MHVDVGVECRGPAHGLQQAGYRRHVFRCERVVDKIVMINEDPGKPGRNSFRQAAAHCAFRPDRVITAVGQVGERFRFLRGLVGNKMDQAAGGVAAEQGALRAFQDFHPLHVEIGAQLGLLGRLVDFIHVHGIGRFGMVGEIVLGGAADGKLVALIAATPGHGDAGRITGYLDAVGNSQGFHLLAADCRDGDTHVLDGLLAFLRGDDDFLQQAALCKDRLDGNNER